MHCKCSQSAVMLALVLTIALHFSVSISAYPAFRPILILQDDETVRIGKCIALFCSALIAFDSSACSSLPRHADNVGIYIRLGLGMKILFFRSRRTSFTKNKRDNILNTVLFIC
ncbi:hypothetical protein V8C42DRAFT_319297 [Trichoderma barbatum]